MSTGPVIEVLLIDEMTPALERIIDELDKHRALPEPAIFSGRPSHAAVLQALSTTIGDQPRPRWLQRALPALFPRCTHEDAASILESTGVDLPAIARELLRLEKA